MSILPDEARLLFMATRPGAVSAETYLAALTASHPNWRAVGALAEREKLLPVLWGYMRDHAELIPEDVREAFRRQAAVTEFRMSMTESALHQVVEQLAAGGIRVMLLKGAALATTVYGSFARRPMGDFDILVPPGDAQRAWDLVRQSGWTLELEGGGQFYKSHHHLPALVDPKGLKLVLEIHRAMVPTSGPFAIDEAELWREARPINVGQTQVWVPSDRYQLLHLSIHFAWSNMFGGIGRTVRDVATMLAAAPMDWNRFLELTGRARARTCAYWTLAMSESLTGTKVPDEVLAELRPRQPMAVTRTLERAYITTALFGACPSLGVTKFLWSAGIQPGASGHGRSRPWQVEDLFHEAFPFKRKHGLGERVRDQLRGAAKWWRFVRALTSPNQIL